MSGLGVLERFARRAVEPRSEIQRCDVCMAGIEPRHRHIVDLTVRKLLCACESCAASFCRRPPDDRHRTVPERVRSLEMTDLELARFGVPIGLAFFFRSSRLGRWVAVFPSPGGAAEAELPDDAHGKLDSLAALSDLCDDVEAFLVRLEQGGTRTSFAVPIDVCYQLVALVKRTWTGIHGNNDSRLALDEFFSALSARSASEEGRREDRTSLERARTIADAILLEGYALYPYRPDTTKNRYRWTFGVVAPRSWSESAGIERWWLDARMLVESERPRLRGRLRFLRVVSRRIEVATAEGFSPVDRLEVGERLWLPWEEGELREVDFGLAYGPGDGDVLVPVSIPASTDIELLADGSGTIVGRVVWDRAGLYGAIRVRALPVAGSDPPLTRISVRIENLTPYPVERVRSEAMLSSFISTHVVVASDDGAFISTMDPAGYAAAALEDWKSSGTYPVLVGESGKSDLMLCSPIILEDHPRVAPESPGDFFDASEIDELLALRTKTLTPEEKMVARATDARIAAIIDRVDSLSDESLARLHGVVRAKKPVRMFTRGQRVRLRPKSNDARRTDAQDLFYAGHSATVEAVLEDEVGREYLAVTIDDDPAADLNRWYGRFHHYYSDEVEPL